MTSNDNQNQPKNKDFYDGVWHLKINDQIIEVTEEVYYTYKRPLWAEKKRKERGKRCRNGKGVRCNDNCNECPYYRHKNGHDGSNISLDALYNAYEYEPSTNDDMVEIVANSILLEQLYLALDQLTEDEQIIATSITNGISERDLAKQLNIPRTTLAYRKKLVLAKLYAQLKDYEDFL